ncbi:hypothetical protein ACLI1A_10310 [Flavobacterium sp. RHBU_3]|uniref:hypothetical protein n=1 Tax=Flavobacterium sp. RHBU_3 TaxID=3391184 RepID=UPI003984E334
MSVNINNYEIKMRILTKPGHENKSWLSFEKYTDKRSQNSIIEGMYRRFKESDWPPITQKLQFYDKYGKLVDQKEV